MVPVQSGSTCRAAMPFDSTSDKHHAFTPDDEEDHGFWDISVRQSAAEQRNAQPLPDSSEVPISPAATAPASDYRPGAHRLMRSSLGAKRQRAWTTSPMAAD